MVELKQTVQTAGYGYKIIFNGKEAGIIEYKDFWQGMPYLSLIKILPEYRGQGAGTQAVNTLADELKKSGCVALITSTRADEHGQHFYRKLGFKESGCLILENTPLSQPTELFFIKIL